MMRYECYKEVFEMNLGITKENVAKMGDLVRNLLIQEI